MIKDYFGWGFVLWLVGYLLGIVFFMIVPAHLIGFFLSPIGIALTVWVLLKKIKLLTLREYLGLSISWTLLAIILDYLFIVLAFSSTDYYKWDVYLYYMMTFVLPLIVGWGKHRK